MQDMTDDWAQFHLQRISAEIKAIGDRATLLLGYLVIVLATLTAFVFTGSGESANQLKEASTVLLAIYTLNASIVLGVLIASFEDLSAYLENPKEKIPLGLQKLNALKDWFEYAIIIGFIALIAVCGLAVYYSGYWQF